MPRSNRPRRAGRSRTEPAQERPLRLGEVHEHHPDGWWAVRAIAAGAATKDYRCPGCDQVVRAGSAHVVAWLLDSGGVDERRHWHTSCWRARARRAPRRR